MEFDDFKANYDRVEICNMTPDALTENTKRHWEVNMFEGSWIRGSTAGGCRNFIGENSCRPELPPCRYNLSFRGQFSSSSAYLAQVMMGEVMIEVILRFQSAL